MATFIHRLCLILCININIGIKIYMGKFRSNFFDMQKKQFLMTTDIRYAYISLNVIQWSFKLKKIYSNEFKATDYHLYVIVMHAILALRFFHICSYLLIIYCYMLQRWYDCEKMTRKDSPNLVAGDIFLKYTRSCIENGQVKTLF